MDRRSALLLAAALATVGSATAVPAMPFIPGHARLAMERPFQSDSGGVILVEGRGRGGGGGGQRAGGGGQRAGGGGQRSARRANPGGFNSNNFHRDVSNPRTVNTRSNRNVNAAANRNTNVNANRNVNVAGGGGCCYGNYNEGPSWGGVAAGVATGAVLGAAVSSAASSPTYAAPPPTYPPGYVSPPPY